MIEAGKGGLFFRSPLSPGVLVELWPKVVFDRVLKK